ncbi:MAG: hypothetical protein HY958_11605 [Bacteroidia bacterium]|nr:hypothetical protein [Bacteroidia bacterium]
MKKKLIANNKSENSGQALLNDLSLLIEQSQHQVVKLANSVVNMLFWQVGQRINEHILQHKRADYGKQIVVTLSRHLTEKYGRNFEEKNLRRIASQKHTGAKITSGAD